MVILVPSRIPASEKHTDYPRLSYYHQSVFLSTFPTFIVIFLRYLRPSRCCHFWQTWKHHNFTRTWKCLDVFCQFYFHALQIAGITWLWSIHVTLELIRTYSQYSRIHIRTLSSLVYSEANGTRSWLTWSWQLAYHWHSIHFTLLSLYRTFISLIVFTTCLNMMCYRTSSRGRVLTKSTPPTPQSPSFLMV